ncbi:MAG: acyl-CoA dehydrogenase family protein [Burkholderiaceae bacterium]|nr:acyl-CoA dehydrogenase family protein [Burkholderiaceae bacterium]
MLRETLRRFLDKEMPRERARELDQQASFCKDTFAKLCELGVTGLTVPTEYGGAGVDVLSAIVVIEELAQRGTALAGPFIHCAFYGAMNLVENGSEAQKRELLPRIARGEIIFAIGYTEPTAGSDLAALKTRAEPDGDHYVINGQKIFTSGAEGADYVWLAARTDPNAPQHKGITIFVMDTRLPGFSVSPIWTVGGIRTNVTFYENVRVPASMIVGEVNGGWRLITEQLNHERVGLAALAYGAMGCFDMTVEWARATAASNSERRNPRGSAAALIVMTLRPECVRPSRQACRPTPAATPTAFHCG